MCMCMCMCVHAPPIFDFSLMPGASCRDQCRLLGFCLATSAHSIPPGVGHLGQASSAHSSSPSASLPDRGIACLLCPKAARQNVWQQRWLPVDPPRPGCVWHQHDGDGAGLGPRFCQALQAHCCPASLVTPYAPAPNLLLPMPPTGAPSLPACGATMVTMEASTMVPAAAAAQARPAWMAHGIFGKRTWHLGSRAGGQAATLPPSAWHQWGGHTKHKAPGSSVMWSGVQRCDGLGASAKFCMPLQYCVFCFVKHFLFSSPRHPGCLTMALLFPKYVTHSGRLPPERMHTPTTIITVDPELSSDRPCSNERWEDMYTYP